MKKLGYLLAALVMAAALFSCEQDENAIVLKKADGANKSECGTTPAATPSAGEVTPVIIPGANNGGNRTCAEVAAYFGLPEGYFLCGEKVDYDGGEFAGNFPDGVMVDVAQGKYVDFNLEAPIEIGGKLYVVGAVIVKGGNAANIYYYPGGSMGDSGLCSPVNASGKAAGLSNLTFCLMEQLPELVFSLKTYLSPAGDDREWAGSRGAGSEENSLRLGYINYVYSGPSVYPLYYGSWGDQVGTITARDYFEEGTHYLEIKLDITDGDWLFYESYLYLGSLEGYSNYLILNEGVYFSQFTSFPFRNTVDSGTETRVFKIPFSEIVD